VFFSFVGDVKNRGITAVLHDKAPWCGAQLIILHFFLRIS
jgi:hypothetical protein